MRIRIKMNLSLPMLISLTPKSFREFFLGIFCDFCGFIIAFHSFQFIHFYHYFQRCAWPELPSARATMLASASKQCFMVLVRAAGLLLYLNLRAMEQSRSFFFVKKFAGSWIINQSIKVSSKDISTKQSSKFYQFSHLLQKMP